MGRDETCMDAVMAFPPKSLYEICQRRALFHEGPPPAFLSVRLVRELERPAVVLKRGTRVTTLGPRRTGALLPNPSFHLMNKQ